MKIFRSTSISSVLLTLSIGLHGQLGGIGSAKGCVPIEGNKIFLCEGTLIPVVLTETISSRDGQPPIATLVTATDVRVDGKVVVAKGSAVQSSINAQPASGGNQPARVSLDIVGVPTVTGEIVVLAGASEAVGYATCSGAPACALLAKLPFGQARMKPGTLLSAWVEKRFNWIAKG